MISSISFGLNHFKVCGSVGRFLSGHCVYPGCPRREHCPLLPVVAGVALTLLSAPPGHPLHCPAHSALTPRAFPLPVKHAPVWLPTWSRPPPSQSPSPSRLVPLAFVLPSPLLCPLRPGILAAACSVPCGVRVPAWPWRHRGGGTLCLLALQPEPSVVVAWWLRAQAPGLSASCLGCIPGSLLNCRGLGQMTPW